MTDRMEKIVKALHKEESLAANLPYLQGAIAYISKTSKDSKKSVIDCNYQTIVSAIEKSIQLQIPIDNRGLAYIDKRYNKNANQKEASLGLTFRAYFYILSKNLDNFDGEAFCVYEGDEITTEDCDGFHSYTHKKADLFASGREKMKGVIVRITYTVGGRPRQKLGIVGVDEIMKIRSKAKTKSIWDEWFDEKAKAAATRRACKGTFDTVQGIQDILDVDNKDFDICEKELPSVKEIIDHQNGMKINNDQVLEIRSMLYETKIDEDTLLDYVGTDAIEDIEANNYQMTLETIRDLSGK